MKKPVAEPLSGDPPPERTDQYILKRRTYLANSGVRVARLFSDGFVGALSDGADKKTPDYSVKFNKNSPAVDRLLEAFFLELDRFKVRHDMPTTKLLSECKRAAAWISLANRHDLWGQAFGHKFRDGFDEKLEKDLRLMVPAQTIIGLCYRELDVDEKKVDSETEKILTHNILKCADDGCFEWIFAAMHCLSKAYARKKSAKAAQTPSC